MGLQTPRASAEISHTRIRSPMVNKASATDRVKHSGSRVYEHRYELRPAGQSLLLSRRIFTDKEQQSTEFNRCGQPS